LKTFPIRTVVTRWHCSGTAISATHTKTALCNW